MKRVLVTGSGGQLGRSIKKVSRYPEYGGLDFTFRGSGELDIRDIATLKKEFELGQYQYCINSAAFTDVELAEKESAEAFAVNKEGAKNVAEVCKKHHAVLVHISTDYVFDGNKNGGYLPADDPNPINKYGLSKWEGERQIQAILSKYFIIRTSWLYSEFGKNFYTTIVNKAKRGDELNITTSQIGCPTHASNLAVYILDLIASNKESYGIHHFTDGQAMTWYEFAKKILEKEGLLDRVVLNEANNYRTLARRPKNSVLVNSQ